MRIVRVFLCLFIFQNLFGQEVASIVKHVSAKDFFLQIKNPGVVIDVRTDREFFAGHIENAVNISTSDPQIVQKLLAYDKNLPIYLYCYSGSRSRHVAIFLEKQGYTSIYNLRRGTIEWKQENLPLVKSDVPTVEVPDKMSIDDFDKVVASEKLVFVDFYAPWCLPCKQMMPMIDELKDEYKGKVAVVKVNADASSELFRKINAGTVPYLVLYKNGIPVFSKSGKVEKDEITKVFQEQF